MSFEAMRQHTLSDLIKFYPVSPKMKMKKDFNPTYLTMKRPSDLIRLTEKVRASG